MAPLGMDGVRLHRESYCVWARTFPLQSQVPSGTRPISTATDKHPNFEPSSDALSKPGRKAPPALMPATCRRNWSLRLWRIRSWLWLRYAVRHRISLQRLFVLWRASNLNHARTPCANSSSDSEHGLTVLGRPACAPSRMATALAREERPLRALR